MNQLIENINKHIYLAIEFNYQIEINKLFKSCDLEIIEYTLNYYLSNIKNNYSLKEYFQVSHIVNLIYKNIKKTFNNLIIDEASTEADVLIEKLFNYKNRIITLPIKIKYIKEYTITSLINNNDLDSVIKLLLIKIAIVNYCLNMLNK